MVGLTPPGERLELDPNSLLAGERTMAGCSYGSVRPSVDFPALVDLYVSGRLKLDELVTSRYRPEETNQAFDDLARGLNARGIIVFDE